MCCCMQLILCTTVLRLYVYAEAVDPETDTFLNNTYDTGSMHNTRAVAGKKRSERLELVCFIRKSLKSEQTRDGRVIQWQSMYSEDDGEGQRGYFALAGPSWQLFGLWQYLHSVLNQLIFLKNLERRSLHVSQPKCDRVPRPFLEAQWQQKGVSPVRFHSHLRLSHTPTPATRSASLLWSVVTPQHGQVLPNACLFP